MHPHAGASRIHIVGGAGSGKTTLARQLSAQLAAPCFDLDEVAYEGGFGRKIPLADRVDALEQIVAHPHWIAEGVYIWWTTPLLDAADVIIWLDLPFYINGWRIVERHFRLNRAGINRHPHTGKMVRFLFHVMSKQIRDRAIPPQSPDDDAAITRVATAEYLHAYAHKLIHCTSPAAVARAKTQLLPQES
jgi:adenylate kinase family enzyme